MANLMLGFSDWGDNATITDSSVETTGFPAENLQATQPTDYWESQSATPYVVLDRGSAQPFNVVALLFTNVASGDTWRIRAADDLASLTDGTANYDSGSVAFRVAGDDDTWDRHHGFLATPTALNRRWVRIDLAVAGGTLEAGRLVLGNMLQPAVNDAYPRALSFADPSTTRRTDGGALISDERSTYLTADIRLDFLTETEAYGSIMDFRRRRGRSKDMFLVLDPEEDTYLRQQMIYGKIMRDQSLLFPQFDTYRHRIQIEEGL